MAAISEIRFCMIIFLNEMITGEVGKHLTIKSHGSIIIEKLNNSTLKQDKKH